MNDFYGHEPVTPPQGEAWIIIWYKRMATLLAISFIFPVYVSAFGQGKLIFPNIQAIGKVGFFPTVLLLYPLFAAFIIFLAISKTEDKTRPIILLVTGLFPIFSVFLFKGDLVAGAMSQMYTQTIGTFLMAFSLMGMYVGSKVIIEHGHDIGRGITGFSGIIFMIFTLLPVHGKGMPPVYFELFKSLKSGSKFAVPGSVRVLAFLMIVIFSAFLYAALLSILNLRNAGDHDKSARRTKEIVFWGSLAIPGSIMLLTLFSSNMFDMKSAVITTLIKYSALLIGIAGLISLASYDLIDLSIPKTTRGADLFAGGSKEQ